MRRNLFSVIVRFATGTSSRLYRGSTVLYYKLMISEELAIARKSDMKGFAVPGCMDKLGPRPKTTQLQFC